MASYGTSDVAKAPAQQKMEDIYGDSLRVVQERTYQELFGLEAPNTFKAVGGKVYIHEESNFLKRILCKGNRALTVIVNAGNDQKAPEAFRATKDFGCHSCIPCNSCQPMYEVTSPSGTRIGSMQRTCGPCLCFSFDLRIFDDSDRHIYSIESNQCFAVCHNACNDFEHEVTNAAGEKVGSLSKERMTVEECCTQSFSIWKIDYPKQSPAEEKSLLTTAMFLADMNVWANGGVSC